MMRNMVSDFKGRTWVGCVRKKRCQGLYTVYLKRLNKLQDWVPHIAMNKIVNLHI